MKRDMDLVRRILHEIEDDHPGNGSFQFSFDNVEKKVADYHLELLVQAKLLSGSVTESKDRSTIYIRGLTWEGHEFLDSARNDTIWKKAKSLVQTKTGTLSFEILKATLNTLIKSALTGDPTP